MSCWSGDWHGLAHWHTASLSCTVLSSSFTDRAGICTVLWQKGNLMAPEGLESTEQPSAYCSSFYPARGKTDCECPWKYHFSLSHRGHYAMQFSSTHPWLVLPGQQRQPLLLVQFSHIKWNIQNPSTFSFPTSRMTAQVNPLAFR